MALTLLSEMRPITTVAEGRLMAEKAKSMAEFLTIQVMHNYLMVGGAERGQGQGLD